MRRGKQFCLIVALPAAMPCYSSDAETTDPREHATLLKPGTFPPLRWSFQVVRHHGDKDAFLSLRTACLHLWKMTLALPTSATWKIFVLLMLVGSLAFDRSSVERTGSDTQDRSPRSTSLGLEENISICQPLPFPPSQGSQQPFFSPCIQRHLPNGIHRIPIDIQLPGRSEVNFTLCFEHYH